MTDTFDLGSWDDERAAAPNVSPGIAAAYYNEIDPDAVAALRQLIVEGVIAPGEVDTRSIKEVSPDDLKGFTQCHFFAGGGVWSYAARLAGWPDSRELWTGSCPCQPFSAAGRGGGTDDARHLWPDFHRLIGARRPPVVMGEQVAGKAGYGWFDGVRSDLAREDFASRTVDIPACAIDAPHQRNRLYWVAVAQPDSRREPGRRISRPGEGTGEAHQWSHDQSGRSDGGRSGKSIVADAEGFDCGGKQPQRGSEERTADGRTDARTLADAECAERRTQPTAGSNSDAAEAGRLESSNWVGRQNAVSTVADAMRPGWDAAAQPGICSLEESAGARHGELERLHGVHRRNGSWFADAEWVVCHDGKARRTKPGLPMLVDGMVGRTGLWSLAGNSISPILAAEVIGAFLDCEAAQ